MIKDVVNTKQFLQAFIAIPPKSIYICLSSHKKYTNISKRSCIIAPMNSLE